MRTDAIQDLDAAALSGREVIAAARLFHRVLRTRLNQSFDEDFRLAYAQYEILQVLETNRGTPANSVDAPALPGSRPIGSWNGFGAWGSSISHRGTADFVSSG